MNDLPNRLVSFLLGSSDLARAVAGDLTKRNLWERTLVLANAWRVIPQLRQRVASLDFLLPEDVRRQLHELSVVASAQSTIATHACATVLQALGSAGVQAAALKGIALIGSLYKGPSDRMVTDIDILVDRADLGRACGILQDLGFSGRADRLEQYIDFLEKQSFHRLDNEFLCLTDEQGLTIDLHWSFGAKPPLEMKARNLLARADQVQSYGSSISVASPVDSIMLTSHHALRNNFAPFATVKDLCDLNTWWTVQGTRWKIEDVVKQAKKACLSAPCLALWKILMQFNRESPARKGLEELLRAIRQQESADANRLEESFMLQLEEGVLNPDFLRVIVNPLTIKQYLTNHIRSAIHGSLDHKMRGEADRPSLQAIRLARVFAEIFRINSWRLASYLALARSENQYVSHQLE